MANYAKRGCSIPIQANYAGCQNRFTVQHLAHFWPFLKAPEDKLISHSQISFKSWFNNVDSELRFILLKSMLDFLQTKIMLVSVKIYGKKRGHLVFSS